MDGKGPNPLKTVGWTPVADVVEHEDASYVLNWACSKLIRKMLISKRSPLPIVQPSQSGKYNVLILNYGLNVDGQAIEGSQFKVLGGTERNGQLVEHFRKRGFHHFGSTGELLDDLQGKNKLKLTDVHVVTANCGVLPVDGTPGRRVVPVLKLNVQVEQVLGIVSATLPSVVFVRMPTPDPFGLEFKIYGKLESMLTSMGYEVTVDIVNSAKYGDYTATKLYVLVAVTKMGGPFLLPTQLKVFGSAKDVLWRPAVVHPRMRAPDFKQLEIPAIAEVFEPKQLGDVTRGCVSNLTKLFDLGFPLPAIGPEFEFNGVNGGQWVLDELGPRLLAQSEMALCLNLDTVCQSFLLNLDKKNAQAYMSGSTPVATVSAFFSAILPALHKITAQANSPLGHKDMSTTARVAANLVAFHFPTVEKIKEEQAKEDDISTMIAYLSLDNNVRVKTKKPSSKYLRDLPFLRLRGGLLFYRHELGDGQILTDSVVMPMALKEQVLKALHDSPFYGHPGRRATINEVKAKCYWAPHMGKDIAAYVKRCLACARAKAFRRNFAGTPKRQLFWQRDDCHCWDFVGPFVSVDGFTYIAHGTNACTGFNYGCAVKNKETITCAEAMHETFMRSGWPKKVITDNGKEFVSKLQDELREQLGYQGVRCCPLSPKGNSFVEGRHRTINAMLKIIVKYYGRNWVKGLPYLFWALNIRPYKEGEKCSYECEYGYVPPSAADLQYDPDLDGHGIPKKLKSRMSPEEWIRTTRANIENAITVVNKVKEMTMVDNIKRENARFYNETHDEGDLVFVHRPICKKGKTSRLLFQNIGPFQVVGPACPANVNGGYNAYRLRNLATDKVSPFNVRDVSPYLKKKEAQEMEEEKEECDSECDDDAEDAPLVNSDFAPEVGDFLLFTGFKDVAFHLIQMTAPVEDGTLKFKYFNTTSAKREVGFAKVWTHPTKKEIFSNASEVKGYESEEHEVAVGDVAQKVIVPVPYLRFGKKFFKLKQEEVADTKRYTVG